MRTQKITILIVKLYSVTQIIFMQLEIHIKDLWILHINPPINNMLKNGWHNLRTQTGFK